MLSRDARYGLAAIQLLVGAEWLVSGANKLLSGSFPQGLSDALHEGLKDNPNGWYVSLLERVVVPHTVFWGYLVEGAELLIGIVLLSTTVLLFGRLAKAGEPWHRLTVAQMIVAAVAGVVGAFLCVNFHFWMGDGFLPALGSTHAFDEAIDLDMLVPPLCLLISVGHLALADELTGHAVSSALKARASSLAPRRRLSPARG
jgi:thiosulfate dehydrogenase [quinone] large subunit